jgi:choline dehydrogenase-like flavoprotein
LSSFWIAKHGRISELEKQRNGMDQYNTGVEERLRPHYDAIVIGSGAGGGTLAFELARIGCEVLVLERGTFLRPERRSKGDPIGRYIHHVAPDGERHFVGGETKFYGAALYRLRESDFNAVEHEAGVSPAWPITYSDLAPYYDRAEKQYRVHGSIGDDASEPPRGMPFPYLSIDHAPLISGMIKRIERIGVRVSAIPRGLDYGPGGRCVLCATCDGYYCQLDAKMDAEIAALRPALEMPNMRLATHANCLKVLTTADGTRVQGVLVRHRGEERKIHSEVVAICAGIEGTASLLRRSRNSKHPEGLGNATGCLGCYLAGHSQGAIFPFVSWRRLAPIHTKSFAINGYYAGAPGWPYPLGVIQMAGQMPFWERTSWPIRPVARVIGSHALTCFHMTEALPTKDTKLIFDGDRIVGRVPPVHNLKTYWKLHQIALGIFRRAGYFVLSRRRPPHVWHEVGTARLGTDPSASVVDSHCQVHGISGLFIADASVMPSAGAINTSLTIMALAFRVGETIASRLGAAPERLSRDSNRCSTLDPAQTRVVEARLPGDLR